MARRWPVDAGLACAVLVAAEIAIVTGREAGSTPRDWGAYLLGVAMAAPVLARRRHPVAVLYAVTVVLLVYYTVGYPGFPPSLVLAVPLYDAVLAGKPWWAIPVPTVFLSIGMLVAMRHGMAPLDTVAVFLPEIAIAAVAILLGALIRSRHAYADEVRKQALRAEQERQRDAERLVVEERLRIARELHDTVAHAVATITVQSGAALHLIDAEPGRAREALTAIRATGKAALAEMRATLDVLRAGDGAGATSDRHAGLEEVPGLLAAVRAAGLEVTVTGDPAAGRLDGPADHAAYRILQESLTNVLRHAGSSARADVRITWAPDDVMIEVSDDGVGPVPATGSGGHGLAGMRERAGSVGGWLETGAGSGGGFRVRAHLPLPRGET